MDEVRHSDIVIATRVSKPLYAKIERYRRSLKKLTGIEPSISAIVRAMIERAIPDDAPRRRGSKSAAA